MPDSRRSEVSEESVVSPPREANQVDGVLQNYLDQLLVVATEATPASSDTPPMNVPEAIEPPEPVAEARPTTVVTTVNLDPGPVTRTLIEETESLKVTDSLTVETSTVTALDAATDPVGVDEIQEWDPYDLAQATQSTQEAPGLATKQDLHWESAQGVECLLFRVAGLKLAIPLSQLGGVHPAAGMKVTPLFGQSDWSLGVWQSDGEKLTVVDSAKLIMPERGVSLRDTGYEYLIQLDRTPWALACEGINDTVTLGNESIKWRSDATKRPWLAGTVISEMCALLDVPSLVELLDSYQRSPAP